MNNSVQDFVRNQLKSGLAKLPENWLFTFKRMYSHDNLEATIDEIVDNLQEDKLDWALTQVENSLKKLRGQK